MHWFSEKGINLLEWPSLSPDLNPIENMWGMMARRVYRDGRQYEGVRDLKEAILEAWNFISNDYICDLLSSMKDRLYNVVFAHGGHSNF